MFGVVVVFMAVGVAAGIFTGSVALLSDAGHMATDAALGMALAAIVAADRGGLRGSRTFGLHRLEILAALANAALLFGVSVYVVVEAVRRLRDPTPVLSGPMLAVVLAGLVVNLVGARLLRPGATESITVRGAYLEVVADLIGSLGVVAAVIGLHPPPGMATRETGAGDPRPGCPPRPRPRRAPRESHPDRRSTRRPRPPRVDSHLRHGRGVRPPRDGGHRRLPHHPRQGHRPHPGPMPDRPRHPPSGTGDPPDVLGDDVVTALRVSG